MGYRFNPCTGMIDLVGSSSSSSSTGLPQYYIDTGDSVTVPEKYEMCVHDEIVIIGTLNLDGRLVIQNDDNNFKDINLYGG